MNEEEITQEVLVEAVAERASENAVPVLTNQQITSNTIAEVALKLWKQSLKKRST